MRDERLFRRVSGENFKENCWDSVGQQSVTPQNKLWKESTDHHPRVVEILFPTCVLGKVFFRTAPDSDRGRGGGLLLVPFTLRVWPQHPHPHGKATVLSLHGDQLPFTLSKS